jgi:cytoskeletal protein CcmA (bactofilin family)
VTRVHPSATVIAARTRVVGAIETPANLTIEGRVEGEISAGGTVTVAAQAACLADIRARTAVVFGEVIGGITCSESIVVAAGARVVGDLRAPDISVDATAEVDGRVDLLPPEPRPTPPSRTTVSMRRPNLRRPAGQATGSGQPAAEWTSEEPTAELARPTPPPRSVPSFPRPVGRSKVTARKAGIGPVPEVGDADGDDEPT